MEFVECLINVVLCMEVEDNTFPNLVAVLSGLSVAELRERCWPNASQPFDQCPLIWKRFQALGYRTAYGEDEPWMGIFNYIKRGFARQPVDYYMRPYARLLLKEVLETVLIVWAVWRGTPLSA